MGDEKTQAQPGDKKQDKPPAPAQQKAPPEQHTGPGRAGEHRKPGEHKPATQAGQAAALQQSVGNQQTNQIMRAAREPDNHPHAPGMKVSHPHDAAEQEAEAVAKKVTGDQPAHPRDHPGPAPGDPTKVVGDPTKVHGDPDVVHRAAAHQDKTAKPPPATAHPTPTAPPAVSHPAPGAPSPASVLDHPGSGEPIPQPIRGTLEAKLKADLRHVVVHHDARADTAVRALHARAVTRGNHIFLASDASPYDLSLMAHEVTHVLRHNDHTVHRLYSGNVNLTPPGGSKPKMTIDSISVPHVKFDWIKALTPLTTRKGDLRDTKQASEWRDRVKKAGVADRLADMLKPLKPLIVDGKDVYYLRGKNAPDFFVFGDAKSLTADAINPRWDKDGIPYSFQIDHKLEYQLGGDDTTPGDNLWLLEAAANQSSGSAIKAEINKAVNAVLKIERDAGKAVAADDDTARDQYDVMVDKVTDGLPIIGHGHVNWSVDQVGAKGEHLKGLVGMTAEEVANAGLRGSPKELVIYLTGKRQGIRRIPWGEGDSRAINPPMENFFYRTKFELTRVEWERGKNGKIVGHGFRGDKYVRPAELEFAIKPRIGIEFGGQISEETVLKGIEKKLDALGLSPLSFDSAEIVDDVGIVAHGKLLPSIPLLSKLDVSLELYGDEIRLERRIEPKDIPAPPPFTITRSSLTLFAGNKGLGARGDLDFQLAQLAHGKISAQLATGSGFALSGQLDFDKTLFDPAGLDFHYNRVGGDYQWGLGGRLGIGPGKVPGIQHASIAASYQEGRFAASGNATLNVPGLESGSLQVAYGDKDGFSMTGTFGLAPSPIISSGTVSATVSKRPPGNKWALAARGTAKPKLPGVDATLSASYEDGVFTVEGQVGYARGMLAGSITVGATNRPVDPQGRPTGAPRPNAPLRLYGGGTLTIRIAPWLQGTVGVQLQPDGSVQLTGEVALPDSINLFDVMQVKKTLLTIGVDIPIVGVAVAGQRIGIFATIQGGLEASAGIGPGQLRQLGLRVRYNPEHEDQTQITGGAQLFIPAQAGLRLFVRGALGAGIPVVSAEAGLEIGGQLGVEGAVQAGVTVNWTPKQGLVIDAQAALSAEPKFRFDINGYVKVSADLFITSVTLYEKHWQLAAFECGSGLRVGVRAPIHYEQGKPFKFSLSDVQFDVPRIDPKQILSDLVHKIV